MEKFLILMRTPETVRVVFVLLIFFMAAREYPDYIAWNIRLKGYDKQDHQKQMIQLRDICYIIWNILNFEIYVSRLGENCVPICIT